ncbi:anthocyanidin-3-O-glucoside rhamnosyltransferase [Cryptomeria japonica]|uniref:anthocyanidin-3-O-glucoside rhamnosyltransferase n=1 Tax=Cryptomeria japonica TaxID=3369 RepID=UPI0027DA1F3E|nr:anthocyanidin-3-O-glucoside rhamnosyltransferase [Cryptomeria japonica]
MATQHQLHVVMFPWLAHGHITPFLELAKSLLTYELRISFVSTPLNIARVKKQIVPGIELVELPLPSIDGLPVGVESTAGLSEIGRTDLISLLFQALDLCEQPFATLLKLLSPDFVIHDTTLYWISRVAAKLGIPTINFMVINVTSTSFTIGQHRDGLPQIPTASDICAPPLGFPSEVVRYRLFEARNQLPFYQNKQHGICEGLSFMDRLCVSVEESWATVCNTCLELEGKFVDYFQRSTGRLMFPVGILIHRLPPRPAAEPCLAWLDRQGDRFVVFASFGSECLLTAQQLGALLLGLKEKGLRFGVPFVALPIQYEQGLTARLIADELRMGVEVKRNEEDGSFTKEDIARGVRAVMVGQEGCRIKSNVQEISRVLTSNDSQIHRTNIHKFFSALKEKASSKQTV